MSEIFIPIGARRVAARFQRAQQPRGTVLFVHGSGVDGTGFNALFGYEYVR